jgi:hypothetical protein
LVDYFRVALVTLAESVKKGAQVAIFLKVSMAAVGVTVRRDFVGYAQRV